MSNLHISNTKKEMWLLRKLEQYIMSQPITIWPEGFEIINELNQLRQEQALRKARHAAMGRGVID